TGHADGELYRWPGDYTEPAEGKELARVRMEREGNPGSRASGSGNLRGMVPGCTFTLREHPNGPTNTDYLILGTHLSVSEVGQASGQGSYHCHCQFEVQAASQLYRSSQRHAKPHTHGPQTAIVTGPAGREIYTDQYGRVKVSFHWNRYCSKDENASCWIRVASPWAGNQLGGTLVPRIGQEVIVDFENGDPDRPLITGRVHNALNMPSWELPEQHALTGLRSRELTPGG
ncbi:type VI secretion system Vgr family protein, partial [Roseateles sp. BYS180W]